MSGDLPEGNAPVPQPVPDEHPVTARVLQLLDDLQLVTVLARGGLEPSPPPVYHVIINPSGAWAKHHECATLDEVVALVRPTYGQEMQVFVFHGGVRLKTSEGGHYLSAPGGPVPLFGPPPDVGFDPDGFMGDIPQLEKPEPEPDDEDEDEDEDEG